MAEVDVATIDRRPTRFYSDIVSPNAGPTLPPTPRAGHRTRQTFSATPTYQVRYLVLVTLKCASNASPLIRLAM